MPTEMHTICFHTRDAVERHDSTFTFDVPKDGLRTGAAKVALASCEFPMVQMTVEKGWDRLYLNEGCRLTPSNNLLEMDYGYGSILLPPRLNEVESVSSRANDSSATLRFAHPHGLWGGAAATRPPLANLFRDVTPQLLGARSLLPPPRRPRVRGRTHHPRSRTAPPSATHLLVPSPPSPSHLCGWLTSAASRVLPDGVRMRFEYHSGRDAIVPTLSVDRGGRPPLPLRAHPPPLAVRHQRGRHSHPPRDLPRRRALRRHPLVGLRRAAVRLLRALPPPDVHGAADAHGDRAGAGGEPLLLPAAAGARGARARLLGRRRAGPHLRRAAGAVLSGEPVRVPHPRHERGGAQVRRLRRVPGHVRPLPLPYRVVLPLLLWPDVSPPAVPRPLPPRLPSPAAGRLLLLRQLAALQGRVRRRGGRAQRHPR